MKSKIITFELFIFMSFLIMISCAEKKISPIQLAYKLENNYEQKTSLSYDIDYQIKLLSDTDDTIKIFSHVDIVKDANDSIFGGYVWIKSDSIERYYNTNFAYSIDHTKRLITKYSKNRPYPITRVKEFFRIYFLDPNRLIKDIGDTTNVIELTNDQISDKELWKLKIELQDNEDLENTWKNIWIDKKEHFVTKINFSVDISGENQYSQWDVNNVVFNEITKNDLESRLANFIGKYTLSEFVEETEEEFRTLDNGVVIPNIKGTKYPNSTIADLHTYRNKLTLYDIWYMDCPPCLEAIPHLNELHKKYNNMGLTVVGVNPINNNEKDLKRMPNFLEHHNIDYPLLLIDREEAKELEIPIYPTFFLVDENSKIIYSKLGFDEQDFKSLDIELNEYLNK